ncbi:hypothetical protein LINPERPRIM_LOCUS22557 [Linum perenne]
MTPFTRPRTRTRIRAIINEPTTPPYGRGAYSADPAANPNVVSRADFDKMVGMFMSVFNQIPGLVIPPELAAFAPVSCVSHLCNNYATRNAKIL